MHEKIRSVKFSIEKKSLLGFSLASAVLFSINAFSSWSFNRHRVTTDWVAHTYQVQQPIETSLAELTEAETEQRAYLLTPLSFLLPATPIEIF